MPATSLELKKRVSSVAITDMQPKRVELNGKLVKLCLNCGKPIPEGNRKYCSLECGQEFFAKHNQRGLAQLVWKRENGTCQQCGWKNSKFNVPPPEHPGWTDGGVKAHREVVSAYHKAELEWQAAHDAWEKRAPKPRDFVADHIIPIALGGAEFDLNNIQLLCEVCNREKTKKDQAEIAKRRKLLKRIGRGGKPLTDFLKGVSS